MPTRRSCRAIWGIPKPVVDIAVGPHEVRHDARSRNAILAEQQQIADTFFALGLIPRKIRVLDAAAGNLA